MITTQAIATDRFVQVLQSIALKQQTGRLYIEHVEEQRSEKGEIFFAHGDTVFARTEHDLGEAALSRMMNWREAQYAFFEGVQVPAGISNAGRIMQRARHTRPLLPIEMEETRQTPSIGIPIIPKSARQSAVQNIERESMARLAPAIPATPPPVQPIGLSAEPEVAECAVRIGQHGVFTIFRALPHATKHDILSQMERRDRVVFLLLNGKRTLRYVAQLVHRSELDVARILVRLLKQGYIEHKSV